MSRIRKPLALFALSCVAAAAVHAQESSIAQLIAGNAKFSTLNRIVEAQGLAPALAAVGPLTLLAPTDEAFGALPAGKVDELLEPANKATATALVNRHLVAGKLTQDDIKRRRTLTAQGGETLAVRLVNGRLRIGDARVSGKDQPAANGMVQALDTVIAP